MTSTPTELRPLPTDHADRPADFDISKLREQELAAVAAIVQEADEKADGKAMPLPPSLLEIITGAPMTFTDLTAANIATSIKRCSDQGIAPDALNVCKSLPKEIAAVLLQIRSDALPLELAELEAAPLLEKIRARRAIETLDAARQQIVAHPTKANAIARNASAALAYQVDEARHTSDGKRHWPAPLGDAAMIGLAGEIVRTIGPETEADPAAILFQFLVCFGNCVGNGPYFRQERTRHPAIDFALIVGNTSKARKGTSWQIVRALYKRAAESWTRRIVSGVGSGEGIIHQVRDAQEGTDEHGNNVTVKGADDKRCMVVESEFSGVLSVAGREGSIVSEVIRQAWDGGVIQTLIKNNPARATDPHVGIIGHITESELKMRLKDVAVTNGFGNRFLPVCAKRARLLPEGGNLSDEDFNSLALKLDRALDAARKVGQMIRTEPARRLWREVYPALTSDKPGSFGAITARAEAHVLRLSIIYALLDGAGEIDDRHLRAALECWRYAEASARYLWGDTGGDTSNKIREALQNAGAKGLTATQLNNTLGIKKADYEDDLNKMLTTGEVTEEQKSTGGAPVRIYRLRM